MSSTWSEILSVQKENRHELVLSGSEISERIKKSGLDTSIYNLNALNYLNISETCLEIISDDLSKLINLQTLVLHSNKLEKLPNKIKNLVKLKTLDVSRNTIVELPSEISELEQLSSLNASSNKLTTIPTLSKNKKLSILDLANNKIQSFPDICYTELVHLAEVKLNKNEIETIPGSIKNLSALKIFDISENKLSVIPYEVYECSKLKELNLKENPIADKRLSKLVDQCRTKQVLDYVKQHCSKSGDSTEGASKGGKKGKKANNKKSDNDHRKSESEDANQIKPMHKINVLHVKDDTRNIKICDKVKSVRPHILACIVTNLSFNENTFKKFIQIQTKLHDSVCDKRNAATIATHDLDKLQPGDLLYTAEIPNDLKIQPLMRNKMYTGAELFAQLQTEADNLRKEKKRNVYSGIHRFLYLLEGKPVYPCLMDGENRVISFPPITNSDITKMSIDTKSMLIEVTSATSQGTCRKVLDTLLYELLFLGIGGQLNIESDTKNVFHLLNVQQMKIIDLEGNMKAVYPSRTDLVYDDKNLCINRE